MKIILAALAVLSLATAAEKEAVPEADAVISERVKALPVPQPPQIPKLLTMAVSSTDAQAQKHVLAGIANLQGSWDFEAYRHFCAALALDPDCLMAHWGVVVALIDPEPELLDERTAALKRMVALVEADAATELERSYAYAIAVFFDQGPAACADAFRKVSERFPNDPQLRLYAAAFGRTGYGDDGKPTPDQERSESILDELLLRDPDHPLYLYAYLTMKAEAPDLRGDLQRARRLCEVAPAYPPFLHLLGHYELRNGNAAQAVDAFARAAEGYRTWMKSSGVTHVDCPGWVKAECYRAAALAAKGDYGTAQAAAKAVAAIEVPVESCTREGAQLLMWEGRTLEARLLMRRGAKGDAELALATLPKPAAQQAYGKRTHVVWYYQGLAFALEARKAAEAGKIEEARKITDALTLHGEQMAKTRGPAAAAGERSVWFRAINALAVATAEVRGTMVLEGPPEGIATAFNWFRAALDRQAPPSMLMPPSILMPMECRLADYFLARGEPKQAVDILIEAQTKHPNDLEVLSRLQRALAKAGHPDQAADMARQIEAVKAQ
jgi:tetratricopeptide (TPR) repeat protein